MHMRVLQASFLGFTTSASDIISTVGGAPVECTVTAAKAQRRFCTSTVSAQPAQVKFEASDVRFHGFNSLLSCLECQVTTVFLLPLDLVTL
ncbi:unnamed protein product [Orchesella dallaii]|uniref:Secreted protein n=1 Tax=Orchesella dallaii TaxID=48710 RepID=A0ABP1RP51_9HEXA